MKKREMIGIIFLVVSVFLLLVGLAINIYVEQNENEDKEKNVSSFKGITFFSVKNSGGENETG